MKTSSIRTEGLKLLENKVIWITGASGGLGRELALEAAKQGAIVVLFGRNESKLNSIKEEIETIGAKSYPFAIDLGDLNKTEQITKQIIDEIGIDGLINNAGFGVFEKAESLNMETVKEMFDVNVIGLIGLTRAVLPYMLKQNSGHIINIASQAGKLATPKSTVYSATKHAVLGFTNGLRLELNDTNIQVSSVNPGPIKTPFFDRADQEGTYAKRVDKWMLDPTYVAKVTIHLLHKPKREINVPGWMAIGTKLYQLVPSVVERIAGKKLNQK